MKSSFLALVLPVLVALIAPSSTEAALQARNIKLPANAPARLQAVRQFYNTSFTQYLKYAKGADELFPLSKGPQNNFLGGWGATMVDSLSTSYLLGFPNFVKTAEDWMVNRVDYSKTFTDEISIFETTIRHVGGLLSAYELGGKKNKALVNQAVIVADKLLDGWDNTDAPFNILVNWNSTSRPKDRTNDATANLAEAGTLLMEFSRLSLYSGNTVYVQLATRAMNTLVGLKQTFPGLTGQTFYLHNNTPASDFTNFGGGADSYYEYLAKVPLLLGTQNGTNNATKYLQTWVDGVKSGIKYLVQSPQGHKDLYFVADYSDGKIIPESGHLQAYISGNWMLGAKMIGNDEIFQWGLKLAKSYYHTYNATASGIGPEGWTFKLQDGTTNGQPYEYTSFSQRTGFYITSPSYNLRPEMVESLFYAWRLTGEPIWLDYIWDAFNAVRAHCTSPIGAAAAIDSVSKKRPALVDNLQSFYFAELMKYFGLAFSDPSVGSLDKYVFNTEAHPFEYTFTNLSSSINVGTIPKPLFQSSVTPL
ncbi:unnamed protein product [Tilletia controversa]|uniref:alpha-1,2-Mannosidase n=3 Tax=Tilletia TaxID=13289 RepID=A0A8X7MYC7_9BASI|nr:hypothetical protein CF336_g2411 [Tilletia laevis]KAE8202441.1 hypothetical protein CF328_g2214 [Tilletia controversa]KAE8264413.1 hypothetical protein A4X03_0g966 [Tilletia caries]KAE8203985.1 hypothetical protein CF335_g2818 [Tilletia laevis]KAE8254206.1 hypothetical protein A4X06_0g1009 [Tilletia controversa]